VLAKVGQEHARIKTICICIKFRLKVYSLTDGEIHIYRMGHKKVARVCSKVQVQKLRQ